MNKFFTRCYLLMAIIFGVLFCGCSSETETMLSEKLNEEIAISGTLEYYANLDDDERELLCEEKHIEVEGILTKKYTSTIWYIGDKKDDFHIECWFDEEPEGVEEGEYLIVDGVCQYSFDDYMSVKKCSVLKMVSDRGMIAEEIEPTAEPTEEPTAEPTEEPTAEPTEEPTAEPTEEPTAEPTEEPTAEPTEEPTAEPTEEPILEPTEAPTPEPTAEPTPQPIVETLSEPTDPVDPDPGDRGMPVGPSNEGTGAYAVNGKNGKIHIVGKCAATKPGSKSEMNNPIYFDTYEAAEVKSIEIDAGLEKRKCGNCW